MSREDLCLSSKVDDPAVTLFCRLQLLVQSERAVPREAMLLEDCEDILGLPFPQVQSRMDVFSIAPYSVSGNECTETARGFFPGVF